MLFECNALRGAETLKRSLIDTPSLIRNCIRAFDWYRPQWPWTP